MPVLTHSFGITKKHQEETDTGQKNKENSNHPWTASHKNRHWSFVCSKKVRRKRT